MKTSIIPAAIIRGTQTNINVFKEFIKTSEIVISVFFLKILFVMVWQSKNPQANAIKIAGSSKIPWGKILNITVLNNVDVLSKEKNPKIAPTIPAFTRSINMGKYKKGIMPIPKAIKQTRILFNIKAIGLIVPSSAISPSKVSIISSTTSCKKSADPNKLKANIPVIKIPIIIKVIATFIVGPLILLKYCLKVIFHLAILTYPKFAE